MGTRFTWSVSKAKRNVKDHGISFELASNVFNDPYVFIEEDCETEEGMRLRAIGYVDAQLLAVVIYLDQSETEEELHYHVISARKAEADEKSKYVERFA